MSCKYVLRLRFVFLTLLIGWTTCRLPAQEVPATQPAAPKTDLLGPKFAAKSYGLEFRPPLRSTEVDKPSADMIVQFNRTENGLDWQLKVWRVHLPTALPLTTHKDQFGQTQDGVLEQTVTNIKNNTPGVDMKRNELINVGSVRVGMIGVRYTNLNQKRRFTQQAIFEAPLAGQQLYYFLELDGPGKPAAEPEDIINPAERIALETFTQVVDSVVLLDRKDILSDQKDRLFRTMALFVNWSGARFTMLRSALVPEQYQRIIRDGKDIGYSYIVEDFQEKPRAVEESTLRIGVRTRLIPVPGQQWDTSCWMTSTADHKHEVWHSVAQCTDPKGQVLDSYTQLASSDELEKAVVLQAQPGANGALGAPQGVQQNINVKTVRTLTVTTSSTGPGGAARLPEFHRDTPQFFVPQAFSYLLPSLLPLKRATTYMFASFGAASPDEPSQGAIVARYLDVQPQREVTFNGQKLEAVEVDDRQGLEGQPTRNYFEPDGKFIGSARILTVDGKQVTETIVPSDIASLQRLWSNPNLTRPQELPGAGTDGAGGAGVNAAGVDRSTPIPVSR
jgi:hypothetical protein